MGKKIQAGLLMCVYVGIVVAVMEILWLLVPETANSGFLWAMFAPLAICFLVNATTLKQCVALILNGLFGIFGGWCIFQLIFAMMGAGMGMIPAFVIGTVVIVFIWQFITLTLLGDSGWGICPMAFLGMMICFAANGENLLIASAGCAAGVVFGVIMVILCGVAAKQVFGKGDAAPEE